MKFSAVPIRREALGQRVAATLREGIVGGQLRPDDRLIEVDLAEQFGVSRGPIRDAFRRLEIEGLIENQQPGMVVIGIRPDDIHEIYSLRRAVELLAIEITMQRWSDRSVAAMNLVIDDMHRAALADDHGAFAEADAAFHGQICVLSGHRRLADVWHQYEDIMMALLRVTVLGDVDLYVTTDKHRLLVDLFASGDLPEAKSELVRHLDGSRDRMLTAWEAALHRRSQTA